MKLSVSIPSDDLRFLDEYARTHACSSRSAALQEAIGALRLLELGDAYADAWAEWDQSGEGDTWESTVGDSL